MTELEVLTMNDWEARILSEEKLVVVDFQAPWCAASLLQYDSLTKLAEEVMGRVKMFQLDASKFLPVAMSYRLIDFPALLLFKNGRLVKACMGSGRVNEMKRILDAYLISNGGSSLKHNVES